MKELEQICQAVLKALRQAGLRAEKAFPQGLAPEEDGPVAAVSVGTAESGAMGFCNYLGQVWDGAAGTVRELYGKQLLGSITVEVRGLLAEACEGGCALASDALLSGLPDGIHPGELCWEALTWEKATGMFLRRGKLQCRAVFVAERKEDGEVFRDFILKGAMEE